MESFKKFIVEATFSAKSIQPVVDRIRAVLERKAGLSFYQYGGEGVGQQFQKAKTGAGVGILFLIGDKGKAIRLNWEKKNAKQTSITSCDLSLIHI